MSGMRTTNLKKKKKTEQEKKKKPKGKTEDKLHLINTWKGKKKRQLTDKEKAYAFLPCLICQREVVTDKKKKLEKKAGEFFIFVVCVEMSCCLYWRYVTQQTRHRAGEQTAAENMYTLRVRSFLFLFLF